MIEFLWLNNSTILKMANLKNTRYMQYTAALTAALSIVTSSMYIAWSSPVVPKVAAGDSPLGKNVTTDESSWIVSSLLLGAIAGSIISGWTADKFGRRGSMLLAGIPLLIPWFVVAFTTSVLIVCMARFIAGMGMAIAASSVLLYNGEIAEKEIRGKIGATFNMAGLAGELFVFSVGPFVSYLTLTLACSVIPLIFLVCFYFMPESPYYLSKIGKDTKAKKHLKVLLTNETADDEIDNQIATVKQIVNEEMKKKATIWELFSKREYRKSLMISFALQSIQQLSGYAAIVSYMQTIVAQSKSSISPETTSILCGTIQLPAVIISAAMVDRAGRKPLFIISALGCAISLTTEGVYFYLQDIIQTDVSFLSWVPTAGILLYIVMRPIGLGTLPFVLMGELFPTNIKGHAIAVSTFYYTVLGFLVTKTFEPVSKASGMHVMFFMFAFVCLLALLFAWFVLPETKGKSLAEIREMLNKKDALTYRPVPKPV